MQAEPRARPGIDRFLDKYPNYIMNVQRQEQPEYLGIGATMFDPTKLQGGKNGRQETKSYSGR